MLDQYLISLIKGFPIIFPTETVYGIGVDAFNDDATFFLYRIKERDFKKAFSLHYHKVDIFYEYAEITPKVDRLIQNYLPGPLTIILKAKSNAPKNAVRNGKIGIRVVSNERFFELMEEFKRPILGTSVNEAGEPPLVSPSEINKSKFSMYPIIKDGVKSNKPSTVLDCTEEPFKILRPGYLIKELEPYL